MKSETSLFFKLIRYYFTFVIFVILSFLPLVVALLVDYYFRGPQTVDDYTYVQYLAMTVLRCNPLIWILSNISGFSFSEPMYQWDLKQNLCVLALLLPSSAVLRVILSAILNAVRGLGFRSFSLLERNPETGEMNGTALAGAICLSVEIGWTLVASFLVERFYSTRLPLLLLIIAVILLLWIGFELTTRFRGRYALISALIDLVDSLFELPVMASLSALLWWCMNFLPNQTPKAIACIVGIAIIMFIYHRFSQGKLFKKGISIPLYYGMQVFFLVCVTLWWKYYMS